jgi:S1-C subfamily serine protease
LARAKSAKMAGLGAIVALLIVAVATSLSPAPKQLTDADVSVAIKQALASATPRPNLAITAFDNIKESVVVIKTRTANETDLKPRGSGVVLDFGATIITSLHVLRDAVEINIVYFDGVERRAIVVDRFAEHDVAVIETRPREGGRKPAVMVSARDLKVGDEAFVVGNALSLGTSISAGVISRLGSTFEPSPNPDGLSYGGLIQFNAPVYPGNSGGALVNRRGELVGLVTWVASSDGVSGIGFAVPMDAASLAPGSYPF